MGEHTSTPTTDAERGEVNTAAAERYDAFFVPAVFGQFPEPVLDHARVSAGGRVTVPKSVIPTVGALVRFLDPEGNDIGAMAYDSPPRT